MQFRDNLISFFYVLFHLYERCLILTGNSALLFTDTLFSKSIWITYIYNISHITGSTYAYKYTQICYKSCDWHKMYELNFKFNMNIWHFKRYPLHVTYHRQRVGLVCKPAQSCLWQCKHRHHCFVPLHVVSPTVDKIKHWLVLRVSKEYERNIRITTNKHWTCTACAWWGTTRQPPAYFCLAKKN